MLYENQKYFNKYLVLKHILKNKKPLIFDIGANVGQSIIGFKKNFPNSVIHSFEPCEDFYYKILKIKKKYKNIFVNNCAIHDKKDNFFHYDNDFIGSNSSFFGINLLSKDYISMKKNSVKKQVADSTNVETNVKIISLDSYIKKNKINYIDILKIDVEAGSMNVLNTINKTFLKNIGVIVLEFHFWDFYVKKNNFYDFENFLRINKNNFSHTIYDISAISKNPKNHRTDYIEAIYLNKNY
jgi:FkbM family methyltransferase